MGGDAGGGFVSGGVRDGEFAAQREAEDVGGGGAGGKGAGRGAMGTNAPGGLGQGEEREELVKGGGFDVGGDGFAGEVEADVLVVERDQPVGEEGGRGRAARDETVVVGGEGGAVDVRQDVGGEVGYQGLLGLALGRELKGLCGQCWYLVREEWDYWLCVSAWLSISGTWYVGERF